MSMHFLKPNGMFSLFKTLFLYAKTKKDYSIALACKKRFADQTVQKSYLRDTIYRNFCLGKMTYLYRSEGQEMTPTIPDQQQILLIRKLFCHYSWPKRRHGKVSVGDIVLVRSPLDPRTCLVRRLAALGGEEMVSAKEEDRTFVIPAGRCWLLVDNQNLKAEEANDSRTWGPIPIYNIIGRVIYRFQTADNHGLVHNSTKSSAEDMAVLVFELELDEMEKCSKA